MAPRSFLLSLVVLVAASFAWAGPREDLLALDHRPTVQEIKNAFGGTLPEQNPFGTANAELQKTIKSNIPGVIATFEKAFPGATFSPLGRDSVMLGDMFDAFYQSLGQNRIVRASASGASRTNQQDMIDFMRGLGVDPAHLDQAPPFIMFDQTNFGNKSQSTTYLNAIYGECLKVKCDPLMMVEKFNFLNTGSSRGMYNNNVITPQTDIEAFIKTQAQAKSGKAIWGIPSVTVNQNLVYTAEYHDTFSTFQRDKDGRVTTKAGAMGREQDRLQILADVFETIRTVSSPEFLTAVKLNALTFNYEFPVQRVMTDQQRHQIRSNTIEKAHLHQLFIEALNQQIAIQLKIRLTSAAHAQALISSLQQKISENPAEGWVIALTASLKISRAKQMDNKDLAAMIFQALQDVNAHKAMTPEFQNHFIKFLDQNPDAGSAFKEGFADASKGGNQNAFNAAKDIYLSWTGISASEFMNIQAKEEIKNFKLMVVEQDAYHFRGQNLFDAIVRRVDPIRKMNSAFGTMLILKTVLQFVDQGKLDRTFIDSALKLYLNDMDIKVASERKALVDILKRSTLASRAFNESCFNAILQDKDYWARQLKNYEAISNELNGTTSEDFTRRYMDAALKLKLNPSHPTSATVYAQIQALRHPLLAQGLDVSSTWLGALREGVAYAKKGELNQEHLGNLIFELMSQTPFDSTDSAGIEFRNGLKKIILSSAIARKAFEVTTALAMANQKEKYVAFRKSVDGPENETKEFQHFSDDALLNKVRESYQTLLAMPATSDAISSGIFTAIRNSNFSDPKQGWFLYVALAADAAEKHRMDNADVGSSIIALLGNVDMTDPANRATTLTLIRKHNVLKKVFSEAPFSKTQLLVGDRIRLEAFRLLYQDYASLTPLAFKQLYLQKQIDDNGPKPAPPAELLKLMTSVVHTLGPDNTSEMWLYILKRYAERVKARQMAEADYGNFTLVLLIQGMLPIDDSFKAGLKILYETNAEFKKTFDGFVLKSSLNHQPYLIKYNEIHKALVGLEGADYESHKLDLSAEHRISQAVSSTDHVNAIRTETIPLQQIDPARGLKKGFELAADGYRKKQIDDAGMIYHVNVQYHFVLNSKTEVTKAAFRQAIENSAEWQSIWNGPYLLFLLDAATADANNFASWHSYQLTNEEWMTGDAESKARQSLRRALTALNSPNITPAIFRKSLGNWFAWQLRRSEWTKQPESLATLFMQEISAPMNKKIMGLQELGASVEIILQSLDEKAIANLHPVIEVVKSHTAFADFFGSGLKTYFEFTRVRPDFKLTHYESGTFLKKALLISQAAGLRSKVDEQLALQISKECAGQETAIVGESSFFGRVFTQSVQTSFALYDGGADLYSSIFELLERAMQAGQMGPKDEFNVLVQVLSNGIPSKTGLTPELQSAIRKSTFAQSLIRRWSPDLFIDKDIRKVFDIQAFLATMPETFNAVEVRDHLVDILFANTKTPTKIWNWFMNMDFSGQFTLEERDRYRMRIIENLFSDYASLISLQEREKITLKILELVDFKTDAGKQMLREVARRTPAFREYFTTQLDSHLKGQFEAFDNSRKSALLEVAQEILHGQAHEAQISDSLFVNYIDTLKVQNDVKKRTDATPNGEAYATWSGKVFAAAPNMDARRTLILNSVQSLLHGVDNGKFKGIDVQLALRAVLVNFSLQDQVLESEFHRLVSEDPRIQILWRDYRDGLKNDPATADAVKRLQARNVNQCVVAIKRIFGR